VVVRVVKTDEIGPGPGDVIGEMDVVAGVYGGSGDEGIVGVSVVEGEGGPDVIL
jgi:hypothetical protein